MAPGLILNVADDVVEAATTHITTTINAAIAERDTASIALSGGSTPWLVFAQLAKADIDWGRVQIYQVDERVATIDSGIRNWARLQGTLLDLVDVRGVPMPVDSILDGRPPEKAAAAYETELPDRFDLIHLGLGDDGHTASLVPGDPVLEIEDRSVAITQLYNGQRRMTLTYPVLNSAREILWLAAGENKASMLARLVSGDQSIPGGRVSTRAATIVTDAAAASGLND